MNQNIMECLKYISDVLEETVKDSDRTSLDKKRFFITDEQREQLQPKDSLTVGQIAEEINIITENNNTAKITTTWITDWLISVGILEINDYSQRVPTQSGKDMGITSKLTQSYYNKMYYINCYSTNMQKYIYDNIDNIIKFHYDSKSQKSKGQSRNLFFITPEQREQLNIKEKAKISEITNELNKFTQENNTYKIKNTWITKWLISIDILATDDMNKSFPTKKGNEIGISRELIKKEDGSAYFQNWYSEEAQQLIYDNIENIINFKNGKQQYNYNVEIISYPENTSLHRFISENKEKNVIIMSLGNCNTTTEEGSYQTALIYQKSHKVLHGDITTNSANRCILYGIKKATEAIKIPSDVMIISHALMGFGTIKSANHDICKEIIDILTDKKCNIKIVTFNGIGYDIRKYINFLAKKS